MVTTTTAQLTAETSGGGHRAGEAVRHGLMFAAMTPCVIASPAATHVAALAALLIVAAWAAVPARRDERAFPALVDAVAMVGAALVGVLSDHGAATVHTGHQGSALPGGSMVVAVLVLVGWVGLRASTWSLALRTPWAKVRAWSTAGMLAAMLSAPIFHG